jgi:hypothetical protein
LERSPVFQSYFEARAALVAQQVAEHPESEDYYDDPDDNPPPPAISRDLPRKSAPPAHQPDPDDGSESSADVNIGGLQSTTNSRARQCAAGTAASDNDPEPEDDPAETEEGGNPPRPAISRDLPRESAPPAQPAGPRHREPDDDSDPHDEPGP